MKIVKEGMYNYNEERKKFKFSMRSETNDSYSRSRILERTIKLSKP